MVVNYENTSKSKLLAGTLACGMHNIRDENKILYTGIHLFPVFFVPHFIHDLVNSKQYHF